MVEAADELRRQIAEVIADYHGRMIQAHTLFRSYELAGELLPLVVAVVAEARTEGAIAELEAAANSKHSVTTVVTASTVAPPEYAVSERFDFNQSERARLLARAAALRGVGNQNAEPRWSANRLEEVLREGLPDQNGTEQ